HLPFILKLRSHGPSQLRKYVRLGIVSDRMHRIEAQPIKAVLFEPVNCVVNKIVAHHAAVRPVKIDGVAPWCAMTAGEESWSIAAKIISLGPEVVVNHIEKNHQS